MVWRNTVRDMRICYVCKGASIHDVNCLRHLAGSGRYDIHLIAHGEQPPEIKGVTSHVLPLGRARLLLAPFLVPLLIRRLEPDLVHGNYLLTGGFFSALAFKRPLLQTARGSDVLIAPTSNSLYRLMVKFALKRADLVVARSSSVAAAINKLGYPAERTRVFPGGVDTCKFRGGRPSTVKSDLGWPNDIRIVICTRNHQEVYGVESLVNAIPEVVAHRPSVRFLFVGSGPLTDHLVQRTNVLEVEGYCKFVGAVSHDLMPEYLAVADVYVSPALSDGTSVSLLEAMACELPVVVTDVAGNLDLVENGRNGIVVKKGDAASLAKAIGELLESPPLRRDFGRRNRELACQKGDFARSMERLEEIYQALLNPS
jgi:glycosyltransferase involved in cell wall biosynthesis